jgi:CheY-like chemotaxis protein
MADGSPRMITTVRTILLVEDDPNDATLTLGALRAELIAKDVVVVPDGAAALDYLCRRGAFHDRSPDLPGLMLVDLKMPKMDGFELLQAVKSHPALKSIPVVVFTSSPEEADRVSSYRLGVNAYVVKPVSVADYTDAVKALGQFWVLVNASSPPK